MTSEVRPVVSVTADVMVVVAAEPDAVDVTVVAAAVVVTVVAEVVVDTDVVVDNAVVEGQKRKGSEYDSDKSSN